MARRNTRKRPSETTVEEVEVKSNAAETNDSSSKKTNGDKAVEKVTDPRKNYFLHRCRFLKIEPTSITASAISTNGKYIACARQNGNIDIWSTEGWLCLKTIFGSGEGGIRYLTWLTTKDVNGVEKDRLISTSQNGSITEWDLKTTKVKTVSDSYGGAVWGAAVSGDGSQLAVACEDGSVRLFDVSEAGQIDYLRVIGHHSGRALCVAFSSDGGQVVSGGFDGTIRVWDLKDNSNVQRIMLEKLGLEEVYVWTLQCLPSGEIVSGDSMGRVQFWDSGMGTLNKTFNYHIADVLTIATSADGASVYASGIDSKILHLSALKNKETSVTEWVYTSAQRPCNNDVPCMVIGDIRSQPHLLCGSMDGRLIVFNLAKFSSRPPVRLSAFPMRKMISCSVDTRRVLHHQDKSIIVYKLGSLPTNFIYDVDPESLSSGEQLPVANSYQPLLHMKLNTKLNISASAMSVDGKWIVYSDPTTLRVFSVQWSNTTNIDRISVKKVKNLNLPAANALSFTPNSQHLLIGTFDSTVYVVDVGTFTVSRKLRFHTPSSDKSGTGSGVDSDSDSDSDDDMDDDSLDDCQKGVGLLACSMDSKLIAVGNAKTVIVYEIQTGKITCVLPYFGHPNSAIAFHPSGNALVVATTAKMVYIFNLTTKRLSDWNRKVEDKLPTSFMKRRDNVLSILFDPTRPTVMKLQSHSFLFSIDTSAKLPSKEESLAKGRRLKKQKQKAHISLMHQSESATTVNGSTDTNKDDFYGFEMVDFQNLIHCEFLDSNTIYAVEVPWIKYLAQMPEPLFRVKYGS